MKPFEPPWGNDKLKEIVENLPPEPISFWPQTSGWWVLAAILLGYAIRKAYLAWQAYQRDTYRRDALAWLARLPEFQSLQAQPQYRQLPRLLRQTALLGFERRNITLLANDQWEQWLDSQCDKTKFSTHSQGLLHTLAYRRDDSVDATQVRTLVNEIRLWIRYHRRDHD